MVKCHISPVDIATSPNLFSVCGRALKSLKDFGFQLAVQGQLTELDQNGRAFVVDQNNFYKELKEHIINSGE